MGDPLYRIDLIHTPTETTLPWEARIYRTDDDTHVKTCWGTARFEAQQTALDWIRRSATTPEPPATIFANAAGDVVPETHSQRVYPYADGERV